MLPIHTEPHCVSHEERRVFNEPIDVVLEKGVIQNSASLWSLPGVLAKDSAWQFCVDYRKLNVITTKDAYPLPRAGTTH